MRGSVSSKQPNNGNTAGPRELKADTNEISVLFTVSDLLLLLCIGFIFLFELIDIFYHLGNALPAGAPKLASSPGERQTQPSGIRISNLSTWPLIDLVLFGCPGRGLATWRKTGPHSNHSAVQACRASWQQWRQPVPCTLTASRQPSTRPLVISSLHTHPLDPTLRLSVSSFKNDYIILI